MKTLQELMQERSAIFDQQQAILNLAETEGRELTPEEETKFNALETDFDAADKKVKEAQAKEQRSASMAARAASLDAPQGQAVRPSAVAGSPVQSAKTDDGGFDNLGEMVHALRFGDAKGRVHNLA